MLKIKILNYGCTNFGSIAKMINSLGHEVEIIYNYEETKNTDLLILPGVGTFPKAIDYLKKNKLFKKLKKNILSGQPVLGICLGMQILAKESEEFGYHKGLNLFSGKVRKIKNEHSHIGWNEVIGLNHKKYGYFYFQHSFFYETINNKYVEAYFKFKQFKLPAIIKKNNILGLQFHPEKSQSAGYLYLQKFLKEI